jgi:2-deoxy-D-gluconate 3-dehydrogenase
MSTSDGALAGRVALVTGGGTGIGAGVSRALARAGARVALTHRGTARSADEVAAVARELDALAVEVDVRDVASIRAGVARVAGELGRIDVLVNSAGINVQQLALDVDEETWDAIVETNLKGLFFCSQAAARVMREQPRRPDEQSTIVNVASQMGLVGWQRRSAYCASKAGVVNLTRVLALEWAPERIRVNSVAPGFVDTALAAPMLADPEFRDEVLRRTPIGFLGEPEDVAAAVVFLAGDTARLVTGHTLAIDGGWTAQ